MKYIKEQHWICSSNTCISFPFPLWATDREQPPRLSIHILGQKFKNSILSRPQGSGVKFTVPYRTKKGRSTLGEQQKAECKCDHFFEQWIMIHLICLIFLESVRIENLCADSYPSDLLRKYFFTFQIIFDHNQLLLNQLKLFSTFIILVGWNFTWYKEVSSLLAYRNFFPSTFVQLRKYNQIVQRKIQVIPLKIPCTSS